MKKRRKARELALQGLYALEISGNPAVVVQDWIKEQKEMDDEITEFASELFRKTVENQSELNKDVADIAENWEYGRIALIDRLILRIALCELLYFEVIPPKVSINEAIELAKIFSTAKSGSFVNGILDSLYKQYQSDDRIHKKGRGLVG